MTKQEKEDVRLQGLTYIKENGNNKPQPRA